MDFGSLISNVGFPIALAVYLLDRERRNMDRLIKALEASVTVIDRSNKLEERIIEQLERLGRK